MTSKCSICGWLGHNARGHAKWTEGVELRHAKSQLTIDYSGVRPNVIYWSERLGRTLTRCKVLRRDLKFMSPRDQRLARHINFTPPVFKETPPPKWGW